MELIDTKKARRLALVRAGLLNPRLTGLPRRAQGRTGRARKAASKVIERFGYLQLDTVSIAGARSHATVLMSRLDGFDPALAEELLQPGEPLFEYWGHEASWLPMNLYPAFEFRRQSFKHHPWWGDLIGEHPHEADALVKKIREEGPLRSLDMDGPGGRGWWDLKLTKKIATALWSSGALAIRERRAFQRVYDLTERVIPSAYLNEHVSEREGIRRLILRALAGHGWATTNTLVQTWRLSSHRKIVTRILEQLHRDGEVLPCTVPGKDGKKQVGWIRPDDLSLADRLAKLRPRSDRGVLLSPFDPVLWDRDRVLRLFGFHQVLEIFKPAAQRVYGYYCLPVLAGDRLVGRFDLKADVKAGALRILSYHPEEAKSRARNLTNHQAAGSALGRYASSLSLKPVGWT